MCPGGTGQPIDREAEFTGRDSGGGLGDFAAFAEVVSRYVQGIQAGLDIPIDNRNAEARCVSGGRVDQGPRKRRHRPAALPGDLDEAIAELLSLASSRPMSPDIRREQFARIEALRLGYDGSPACSQKYP